MTLKYLFFSALIFLSACSKPTTELSESESEFADLLAEVYLVNGLANQIQTGGKDSLRNQITIQVLKAHDMDTTAFYKKLYKMEKDPTKFKITYDTVVARLQRIKDERDQKLK